jgi:hypothetical protein
MIRLHLDRSDSNALFFERDGKRSARRYGSQHSWNICLPRTGTPGHAYFRKRIPTMKITARFEDLERNQVSSAFPA